MDLGKNSNGVNLDTPVEEIPKIGPTYQKKLKKLGINNVLDLLYYFPARYDDFSNMVPISKVKLGYNVCVQGRILEVENTRTFKKFMSVTKALIEDDTGTIKAVWFNQPYLGKSLKEDDLVCLAGKVSLGKDGIYLNNPAYERVFDFEDTNRLTHTGRIVPVYSETRGLTSRWLRYIIKPLLLAFQNNIPEILPPEIIRKQKLLAVRQAIRQVHFPDSFDLADAAKARFSFEELLLLQLFVLKEKLKLQKIKAPACPMNVELMKDFTKSLPFELTNSQKQASFTILKDLEKSVPMSRLLEGDVGSGKTVVATMAALNIVKSGYQVAFMAPTEILAKQHFKSVVDLLKNFNVSVGILTGKEARISRGNEIIKLSRKDFLEELRQIDPVRNSPPIGPSGAQSAGVISNGVDIVIGTHSLIQKGVYFKNLALVIVDEQHRFGVDQRAELMKNKELMPHLLSMTATPIPRTLALTVYGDLDLSLIKEMPKDRKKIKTLIVEPSDRKNAYEFIRKEIRGGKGVFVICPKIEPKKESNTSDFQGSFTPINYRFSSLAVQDVKAVKEEYEKLSKEVFPDLKIAMMYGKMKSREKEEIMRDFKDGKIDMLVSTSVVEVGIDVPRATVMMIEGAERFGLSQLHQFRGRVGRSDMQSYCFLFTTSPDQLSRKRLKAMVNSNNGFELAQKDLEIRGPGQLYGTNQWGLPDMAMQSLFNIFLVEKTRQAAKELLEKDLELKNHPLLLERVEKFKQRIHFE